MGLVRGMARTAVIAGTATAVSNRVSRRQANRWNNQAEADAYEQQQQQAQYQQQYAQPQQYAPPPQQYAQPQYAPPPAAPAAAAPAAAGAGDVSAELERLGALHTQGLLTDEEFSAAKAKLLGI